VAKDPAVIGVLTEPTPPTWWRANRHKVLLIAGALIGFWIGTHTADADAGSPPTTPPATTSPTRPASPAP
jgi:hypothetical protein